MIIALIKKLLGVKSPSATMLGFDYEYDLRKAVWNEKRRISHSRRIRKGQN